MLDFLEHVDAFYCNRFWLSAIIALVLGFVSDMVWARLVIAAGAGRARDAANWSLLVFVCGVGYTLMISGKHSALLLIFMVGMWLGMYVGVKTGVRNEC